VGERRVWRVERAAVWQSSERDGEEVVSDGCACARLMQDCRCQFGGEAVVMAGIFEAHAGMAAAVEKLRSGLRGYLSVGSRSAASRKARLWS
jgi:hypothetical protein